MTLKRICQTILVLTLICVGVKVYSAIVQSVSPDYQGFKRSGVRISDTVETNDNLAWFIHLSDVHFSITDQSRAADMKVFCKFLRDHVQPGAVILSGDLTQSRDLRNRHLTRQVLEEWKTYSEVLNECQIAKWFDLRGNHDTFNVAGVEGRSDFFSNFSAHSNHHGVRSYVEHVKVRNVSVAFIGIDATPLPGMRAPFNFMGFFNATQLQNVQALLNQGDQDQFRVVFGHYPTSFVGSYLRDVIKEARVYFCGHLHTMFGWIDQMFTRHSGSKLLELELGDWKENRRYRIFAFDQGQFAFADMTFESGQANTAVIITNPRDPLFSSEQETYSVGSSRSIRTLVFSDQDVKQVTCQIDMGKTSSMIQSDDPDVTGHLYELPWNPKEYQRGLHVIKITVQSSSGNTVTKSQTFSLDGSHKNFPFLGSVILLLDWVFISKLAFLVVTLGVLAVLVFFRWMHFKYLDSAHPRIRIPNHGHSVKKFFLIQVRKLWILSALSFSFWTITLFTVYLMFLPWCLGAVIDEKIAFIFVWGILLLNPIELTPPNMTFFYGFVSYTSLMVPVVLIMAQLVDQRFRRTNPDRPSSKCEVVLIHAFFIVLLWFQLYHACIESLTYGLWAGVSPYGLGWAAMTAFIYWKALNLGPENFRDIARIWSA